MKISNTKLDLMGTGVGRQPCPIRLFGKDREVRGLPPPVQSTQLSGKGNKGNCSMKFSVLVSCRFGDHGKRLDRWKIRDEKRERR